MSFQAYLDNIEAKTGKAPQHFVDEAAKNGFDKNTKSGEIIQWLADGYGLGRGHAMALVHVIKMALRYPINTLILLGHTVILAIH